MLQPRVRSCLLGLEVFLDRWVLAIYADGFLNVWDLEGEGQSRWANTTIHPDQCASYTSTFDTTSLRVTLAVVASRILPAISRKAMVYEIQLSETCAPTFNVICVFPLSASSSTARRLDVSKGLLAFSQLCTISLFRWPSNHRDDIFESDSCNIRTYQEEREEMYTTIHTLEFVGPYILVLKTRSVEIHPIPPQFCNTNTPCTLPTLRHHFRKYSFRDFCVAQVEKNGDDTYVVKFLASDVIQGLFFFSSTITIPSNPLEEPTLHVDLVYIHSMIPSIPVRRLKQNEHALQPSDEASGSSGRLVLNTGHVRSPFFVSAFAMGPQGMRGVWIERRRGTMAKHIVTCRFTTETEEEGEELLGDSEAEAGLADAPILLDGRVVHTLKSPDLNEDLMHCALGEVGGIIVVGNRSGDVLLLDIGV
ncbi:hypothetical protein E1B28_007131 [Marasmius oreades]|nr:uncharacterized protein E1B28_007131 [Marasmius oreades]KAG7093454.1 hypothetical protein E1B28_007131 [Marasmius oreades]